VLTAKLHVPAGRRHARRSDAELSSPFIYDEGCTPACDTVLPEISRIHSMNAAEVKTLIEAGLPGADVRVVSADDTHFEAVIVASQFKGKRMIQRHQLVYGTLGSRMGREIHALTMQAFAPSEREQAVGRGL
jgi:acid stress-induced BolA-like protein IbaG/YrbA